MSKRGWLASGFIVFGFVLLFASITLGNKNEAQTYPLSNTQPSTGTSSKEPSQDDINNYSVAPEVPKYMTIPAINMPKSRIIKLGLLKNNQIASPDNIHDVGWYKDSSKPGQPGAMFAYGHVSSWSANGIFHDLNKLKSGDKVVVTRGDNKTYTYRVESAKTYSVDNVPMSTVLAPINQDVPGLNLMTCTGKLIKGTNEFSERLVVYALLESQS